MFGDALRFCLLLIILAGFPGECLFLIVPEDVPAGFAAIFGFTPRIMKGNDHRIGFGFRLGNHADFQVLYELGPQTITKPLQPVRVRSATYKRVVKRRPLIDFLLNLGILQEESFRYNIVDSGERVDHEPR